MTRHGRRSTSSYILGWQMRECPLSRHLGMEAPAPRPPRRWPGLFISARDERSSIVEAFIEATAARRRRSQRPSNRLDPGDGCCCRKEHRKKVRPIRPRQAEAEQGDQRNYGELPYFGVHSLPSHLLLSHTGECARSGWHPWPELDCIRKMASILLDAVCAVNRENTS